MHEKNIEEELRDFRLPVVPPLRHQETALRQLFTQRRSSALVIWVVALPLYVIMCAVMQMLFHKDLPLMVSFEEITKDLDPFMAAFIFCILPFAGLVAIVSSSMRVGHGASSQRTFIQLHLTIFNAVLSVLVIAVMMVYLLSLFS